MGARAATELLVLPVRHLDIELGRPVDLLLDLSARRALGLEVRCRDEVHRFLPLGAARIGADGVEVGSPLMLLDDLAFYRARSASMRALRGTGVRRAGHHLGALGDVLVDEEGALKALRIETHAGSARIPFTADVELESKPSVAA